MTLEEYVARINSQAFWKEFTFAENKFAPHPGRELELADNLVWLGDFAIVLQLKARETQTDDPAAGASWFRKKVLDKAVSQVRDSIRYLEEHLEIRITNEKGDAFDVRGAELREIVRVIVFLPGPALPEEHWQQRFHVSKTVGFIHLIAAHDYLGIVETLRVPEDIRRYLAYREAVSSKIKDPAVEEPDIIGAFLSEEDVPTSKSRAALERLVQDLDGFDLSRLIGKLSENIEASDHPLEYYRIMLEFARTPRSVWREVKARFMRSLEVVQAGEFTQAFRLTFPPSGCTFMIAPVPPEIPVNGPEGAKLRVAGVRNLTHAAMYDAKTSKGVGIQISKDVDHIQIDWCLIESAWAPDPEMDKQLAERNPFRPAREKKIDGFLLADPDGG